jgi:hypothetical protein
MDGLCQGSNNRNYHLRSSSGSSYEKDRQDSDDGRFEECRIEKLYSGTAILAVPETFI